MTESEKIEQARALAVEFIKRADVLLVALQKASTWPLRERSALRRQSMELTRALADLRKSK